MKYFLIAGEASGDMHAARLIEALHQHDAEAVFVGLGGDKMQAAGCKLYQHYSKMAYMGYVAVLAHLGDIRRNVRIAEQALLSEQPDELILIDYPNFNLHIAAFCRKHLPRTKVTYYIPPKIWAWKRRRVHKIGKYCHRILGIFPFEPAFYAKYGYACTYVGNP
ncbi:MAG: lipid-A-disaccharide synthase, partial [Paludibacteraceae bacterium]|nr:lipid-A-disaccharide synthase [Paludibacteraceae bacterium]